MPESHYYRSVLSRETHTMMLTPTFVIDSARQSYIGLGWFINNRNGEVMYEQGGSTLGYQSSVALMPAKKITIVILCNSDEFRIEDARDKILDILLSGGLKKQN